MAIERDLVIEQGETITMDYRWVSKLTKVPVDLTACEFVLQARKDKSPTSPLLLDMSTTNGKIVITDALEGKFSVRMDDEYSYTLALTPEPASKRAYYELMCYFPSGEKRKLMKGPVVFYKATVYP